ncbi:MAG: glycosyltransferase family 2 protein [Elainellaceae cyanobacterium]
MTDWTSMPLVSVIIPAYRCDRYIAQAVDSVLHQTYPATEVIVVDDGSPDNTAQVLAPYGDRIRYVKQKNQGVAIARNHGIQLARGELVAFLDADDYFLPHKLADQVAVFSAQPDLGLVHSGWRRVSSAGEPLMEVTPWKTVPTLDLEHWLRWKPVLPSAMMFQRSWLERAAGFDPRFPPAEDTDLVLRLAAMGCRAAWLKQVTVCYRQHEQSAMHKGLPQARSLAAVIDAFFQRSDLSEEICLMERQIRYETLVWIAWYLYDTGHIDEMVDHLRRAWTYCPYAAIEAVIHWAESFSSFSKSWGKELDVDALGRSPQWQELMRWLLQVRS